MGFRHGFEGMAYVLDKIDKCCHCKVIFRQADGLEAAWVEIQVVFLLGHSDRPQAGFNARGLPSLLPGTVQENPRCCSDVEKDSLLRMDLAKPSQDTLEVFASPALLLVVEGVFYAGIKGLEEVLRGSGVGENMAAIRAEVQIPGFPVLTVRDLDLFCTKCLNVERSLPEQSNLCAGADGTVAEVFEFWRLISHGYCPGLLWVYEVLTLWSANVKFSRNSVQARRKHGDVLWKIRVS